MPLNPELFNTLRAATVRGPAANGLSGRVLVANEGARNIGTYFKDPATGRTFLRISQRGESYRVNCPWCDDGRNRLWINHAWGELDMVSGTRNRGLLHCFNEGCEKEPGFLQDLQSRVNRMVLRTTPLKASQVAPLPERISRELVSVEMPPTVPLDCLGPHHPATRFLVSRGHSPEMLQWRWGVGWCEDAGGWLQNRLVVPILFRGVVVGYQARYLGDGGGKPEKGVPKWVTSTGTPKSRILFNYDTAKAYPFVIATEGPLDAIRIGTPQEPDTPGPAVSLFGTDLNSEQAQLILSNPLWRQVFLVLDDDAWEKALKLYERLPTELQSRCILVPLPPGKGPNHLTHPEIWGCVRGAAECVGSPLPV